MCEDKHWHDLQPFTTDVVNVSPTQLRFTETGSWSHHGQVDSDFFNVNIFTILCIH